MDRFCMICSFQPKTYAGLAKYTARYRKVHICAADGLSSTVTVYDYIEKDKNADLAIADGISDALDMCAKDDLIRRKGPLLTSTQTWEVLFQTHDGRLAGELATAESITAKDPNHVDTFSLDFAFSFTNILSLIAFIISYCLFADELVYASRDVAAWLVYVIIRNLSCEARRRRSTPSTLLARFIPITKIRDPLLKTLENAAKSRILLACADGRIRQCYLTICAILADYEEQVLLTSIKKNRYCTRYTRCLNKGYDDFVHLVNCFGWKHYNFNIYVSLATDTLHLLLKGLVMKMLDFMQDMLDDIYPSTVVSLLFVLKAPFALHFIRAVCDLVTLAQYKNIRMYRALDSICTRANSEAHYITILILGIQPYLTKLPLSEVAANIAISNFIYAAAVFRSSSKRHNDPKYCDEEVVRCAPNWQQTEFEHRDNRRQSRMVTDDRKHMAYIRAFSEVLLFNNNRQINNTTRMLSVPFKFYDLSTIIRLVHLVLRDLPNLITCTTMSYYVNNYIN
ncbi:hypothetical protein HBI26_163610 [Parastagonospora nodorum]|nr:hypothetical protein HBI26_163610 [Parastagonospora nodorum]